LPVRKERAKLRDRWLFYTVYLTEDGRTLIHQRKEKDIWQHLWEFPLEEVGSAEELGREDFRHVLSHQRLHARFEMKRVSELPELEDYIAIRWEQLEDYGLSRLTLRFLETITKNLVL